MQQLATRTLPNSTVKLQDQNADDFAVLKVADAGRTIWVQSTDPGGSAVNGDIWIDLP